MPDPAGLFTLGLTYGLTVCSLTCLPFLAPYLMGTGQGFKTGMVNSVCFLAGKLMVYAAMGGVAAYIGQAFDFGTKGQLIMGLVLIGAALSMPYTNRRKCKTGCRKDHKNISMIAMGAGSSLAPCPPLAAIFMLAAQRGSVVMGVSYGLIYGLGLLVSPLIIAGGSLSFMSSSIRQQLGRKMIYIEGVAMLVMVSMGVNIIMMD